jgi:hypothetical protein
MTRPINITTISPYDILKKKKNTSVEGGVVLGVGILCSVGMCPPKLRGWLICPHEHGDRPTDRQD